MRKIICIGRQFGSGGHLIAKRFAKQAGIEYYDRRIVERAIEVSGMARGIMERADERMAHPLLQPIYYEGNSKKYYGKNANDILFEVQREIIFEDAAKSDCIFVGRCADCILREKGGYAMKSIFFVAPMEFRIRNTMEVDHLTEKEAAAKVRKMDKARSVYYNYYTGHDWGKPSDYSYCINVADHKDGEIMALLAHIYEIL